jgi:hypothetical protein
MVPLNEELVFYPGDQVRLTGSYRDDHGHVTRFDALDVFTGCGGMEVGWRYVMLPPTSSEASPCVA